MNAEAPFEDVEAVVAEPLKFKAKLALGEDTYTSLRSGRKIRELWEVLGAAGGGAAVAGSSAVATTFFAPAGFWGLLGLGTAVTPFGWVIAAAVVSGGAAYGIQKALNGATASRVTVVPKFINTPIDALGVSLFDLMAPLAMKLALMDGTISEEERASIKRYLTDQWGYDPAFVDAGLAHIEGVIDGFTIGDIAARLANFQKGNPDCNYEKMCEDIVAFLGELSEADGIVDERKELALQEVQRVFAEAGKSAFAVSMEELRQNVAERLSEGTVKAREAMTTIVASDAYARAEASAEKAKQAFGDGALHVAQGLESAARTVGNQAARTAIESASRVLGKLGERFKRPSSDK
jgi:hypothetical protein